MRVLVASMMMASVSLSVWGCGSTTSNETPVAPTPTAAPAAGVVTINIVSENGAQSFSPNPATLPAGQMVVWHNIDGVTHRVVLNNGALDTGDLRPGATSQPMVINAGGGYHCSIHPSMVGTIIQSAPASSN